MKIPFGIKEKEEDVKCIIPSNFGWLEKKLSDPEMDYFIKDVNVPIGEIQCHLHQLS